MENDNYKILGVIFLCEFAIIFLIFLLIVGFFLLNSGLVLFNNNKSGDFVWVVGMYAAMVIFYIIFMTPFGVAGWKLLKNKNGAKGWGVAASVFSLLFFFPFGIIIGILGFVILFSNAGNSSRQSYNAQPQNYYPPPPNQYRQ